MAAIQDILSPCGGDAFEYDPAQRYLEEHCQADVTPAPMLPSLSYPVAETSAFQMSAISPSSKTVSENVDPPEPATPPAGGKKSRYLREMDRRAILARLDKGEKQSVLAKEYHVSRSSICNLFKHRDEVLSRVNQNPFTKHPKRPKPAPMVAAADGGIGIANRATEKLITCVKAIYSPFSQSGNGVAIETDMMVDTTGRVHRVNSRAASVLLQILDKADLSVLEFRRCANQIMLLLVEEALAMLPALVADANGAGRLSLSPLLSITMEQANQHAMLDVFHSIEPNCPRGYVQFERSQWHQDVKIKLLDTQLSCALSNHNVLLLDVAVTSPSMVAFVIESLLRNGAHESKITVVAVFVARAVVELVQSKFPAVRIIATDFESGHALDQRGAMPRSVLFKHRLDHMYSHAI
ncbi:hypothetical protein PybrP1_010870 [[Pythium] brassicae (nom. inval.)]|nr:hypothetical protein PybrP1_010870 [[Pythium] brassicae (nom. inval.)]